MMNIEIQVKLKMKHKQQEQDISAKKHGSQVKQIILDHIILALTPRNRNSKKLLLQDRKILFVKLVQKPIFRA